MEAARIAVAEEWQPRVDQLSKALENVFAVLDRHALTYAERISYARALIRTARGDSAERPVERVVTDRHSV